MALLLVVIALFVWAIDQLVKNWVVANLTEGELVPVLGNFLRLYSVRNPGAAFSMASGATWIFTALAVGVVIVILTQLRKLKSIPWAVFLGLLLGGVLGNLTDRLTRAPGFPEGHVVDFISTPWMWLGFSEAIYNIADIAIVSGMVIFVLISIIGLPITGESRAERKAAEAAEDAAKAAAKAAAAVDAGSATETGSTESAARTSGEGNNGTP